MENKNNNCPCKRVQCERHGNCLTCKEHHLNSPKKVLNACDRIRIKQEKKQSKKAAIKAMNNENN